MNLLRDPACRLPVLMSGAPGLALLLSHGWLAYLSLDPRSGSPAALAQAMFGLSLGIWLLLPGAFLLRGVYRLQAHGRGSVLLAPRHQALFLAVFGAWSLSLVGATLDERFLLVTLTLNSLFTALLLVIVLAVMPWRWLAPLGHLASRLAHIPTGVLLGLCAALVVSTGLFLNWDLFRFLPWPSDAIVQYAQARVMAGGHLTGEASALQEHFSTKFIIEQGGRWFSQYPPGHMLMLALGHLAQLPWLVAPLEGAASVIAIYFLARETYGQRTARLAALLMALSPFVWFQSAQTMNHSTSLLFASLFFLFFVWAMRDDKPVIPAKAGISLASCAAGACLGMLFITRPVTAVCVALPFALWGLVQLTRNMRTYIARLAVMALVFACFVAFQLWYNAITTGDPFTYAYVSGSYSSEQILQGDFRAEHIFSNMLLHMNVVLFGWGVPNLLFAVLALAVTRKRMSWLFAASVVTIALVHLPIPALAGGLFGRRRMVEVSGLLAILSAQGLLMAHPLLRRTLRMPWPGPVVRGGVALLLILLTLSATIEVLREWALFRQWADARGNAAMVERISTEVKTPALVLLPQPKLLAVYHLFPQAEDASVIYAADLGHNEALLKHFRGRNVYRWEMGELKPLK